MDPSSVFTPEESHENPRIRTVQPSRFYGSGGLTKGPAMPRTVVQESQSPETSSSSARFRSMIVSSGAASPDDTKKIGTRLVQVFSNESGAVNEEATGGSPAIDDKSESLVGKPAKSKETVLGKPGRRILSSSSQPRKWRTVRRDDQDRREGGQRQGGEAGRRRIQHKPGGGLFGKSLSGIRRNSKSDPRTPLSKQPSDKSMFAANIKENKALIVKNIPMHYNTRAYIFSHFNRFGDIERMYNNPNSLSATIYFETHEGAAEAKSKGTVFKEDGNTIQLNIFWKKQTQTSAQAQTWKEPGSTKEKEEKTDKNAKKPAQQTRTVVKKTSDVDDELAALQEADDYFSSDVGIPSERPKELIKKIKQGVNTGTGMEAPDVKTKIVKDAPKTFSTQVDPRTKKPVVLFGKTVSSGRKVEKPIKLRPKVHSPVVVDLTADDDDEETPVDEIVKKTEPASLPKQPEQSAKTIPFFGKSLSENEAKNFPSDVTGQPIFFGVQKTEPESKFGSVFGTVLSETKRSATESLYDSSKVPGLFGKPKSEVESKPVGLFGKPAETEAKPSVLFGKPEIKGEGNPDILFGKQETVKSTHLFGKPVEVKSTQSSLFGKPISETGAKAEGLFGKPSQTAAKPTGLFGKPVSETETEPIGLFGKPEAGTNPLGLFGKPVSQMDRKPPPPYHASESAQSIFGKTESGQSIFGKTESGQSIFGKSAISAGQHSTVSSVPTGVSSTRSLSPTVVLKSEQPAVVCQSGIFGSATLTSSVAGPGFGHQPSLFSQVKGERGRSASPAERRVARTGSPAPSRPVQRAPSPHHQKGPKRFTNIDRASYKELKALQGRYPKNVSEQIEILNTRDSILQEVRKKKQGKHAGEHVTCGTCMDMCPEKERLMREEQRRLHAYELIPGTERNPRVDHSRAVKEYSRSSADQEFPLSHELRPCPVLEVTMNYLLGEIANRGQDGEWGEWYDFLWSRTRGIRKDITQQRLCNASSVSLIEKCARFHIYCAERLCEEDMSVFDVKINNENLTKCLQSLKEMYHDLKVKHKVYCENEAEFRAYMVLMNLNQGDTLREVQQLDDTIRKSPEVHFVIGVYSALNTNNYVRFFKLVRKATFLNACIMHRYFNQVRVKALRTIIRSHSAAAGLKYPLNQLAALLGFENEEQVSEFCQHHEVSVGDGGLLLERTNQVITPETAFPPQRAIALIENKLASTIGEIINGGPVDEYELPYPSTSFDMQGRFKGVDVEGIGEEEEAQYEEPPEKLEKPTVPVFPNEVIKQEAKDIFLEVIDGMAKELAENFLTVMKVEAQTVVDEILNEEVNRMSWEICHDVYTSIKTQQETEARVRAELEAAKQKATDEIMEEIVTEVTDSFIDQMSTQEYQEVQARLKKESIDRSTHHIAAKLLEKVLNELTQEVSETVFETDVTQKLQHLEEAYNAVRLLRTLKWWNLWRQSVFHSKKLKRGMQTFPSAPSMLDPAGQLQRLLPGTHGLENDSTQLINGGKLTLQGAPEVYAQQITLYREMFLHRHLKKLKHDKAWSPLDVPRLLEKAFLNRKQSDLGTLYWKLLVSVEDINLAEDVCSTWLLRKLQKGRTPTSPHSMSRILSLYRAYMSQSRRELGICIRALMGSLNPSSVCDGDLQGSSGLLFLITKRELANLTPVKKRLTDILCSLLPIPLLPVSVLVESGREPGDLDLHHVVNQLGLDEFKQDGRLLEYTVYDIGKDIEEPFASTEVSAAVHWLAKHCPPPIQISNTALRDLIETCLSKEYYNRVYQNLAERKKKGYLDQDPNILIGLYNSIMEFLVVQVLSDEELTKLSWPVTEFAKDKKEMPGPSWNSEPRLHQQRLSLMGLYLPEFTYSSLASDDWEVACTDVLDYLEKLINPSSNSTHVPLFTRVRWLLTRAQEKFENECFFVDQIEGCQPCYVNMPWTEVIDACITHKLQDLPSGDEEIHVNYIPTKLSSYTPPASWFGAVLEPPENDPTVLSSVKRASAKRRKSRHVSRSTPQKIPKKDKKNDLDLAPVSIEEMESLKSVNKLKNLLALERKHTSDFEAYLTNQLNPSTMPLPFSFDSSPLHLELIFETPECTDVRTLNYTEKTPTRRKSGTFSHDHAKKARYVNDVTDSLIEKSISEEVDDLKYKVARAKEDDDLFEMKLKSLLIQTDLDYW